MNRRIWILAAAAVAGCGTATLELVGGTEEERLASAEHKLGSRVRDAFGEDARVQHVLPQGDRVIVGVAVEGAPIDGDALPGMGFAVYSPKSDALEILAKDTIFREARLWGAQAALVSEDGELVLKNGDAQRVLAKNVRGDIAIAPDGKQAALTLRGESLADGETGVALVDLEGNVRVLVDEAGVDDRPAISPDGRTVVFVSGRSGVASFFRTTLEGEAPVQLTNVGIEPGSFEDAEPAGFVPPPVNADELTWLDADTLRYDAGGGELWTLNIRTGVAAPAEGGAK